LLPQIESQISEAGIDCDAGRLKLLEKYVTLLVTANEKMNLTAIKDEAEIWDQLVLRSMRFHPVMSSLKDGDRVIDVGAGAGIPGMVAAIIYPSLMVTMIDATGKKIRFVSEAISEVGITNARAFQGRAEQFGQERDHREHYDLAVARAVGSLTELAELLLPLVTPRRGKAAALKGADIHEELALAAHASAELGAPNPSTAIVASPGSSDADTLVTWAKTRPTPRAYPRRDGVPHKKPLYGPQQTGPRQVGARR
jgi:16S rRNA (guanine527-N7)-methyltransferase